MDIKRPKFVWGSSRHLYRAVVQVIVEALVGHPCGGRETRPREDRINAIFDKRIERLWISTLISVVKLRVDEVHEVLLGYTASTWGPSTVADDRCVDLITMQL